MSGIPEDVTQAAEAAIAEAQSFLTAERLEGASDKQRLIHDAFVSSIEKAIRSEREAIFDEIQSAYRRGVDFACEGVGVADEDYVKLWESVPKAAYDYADKATAPKGGE